MEVRRDWVTSSQYLSPISCRIFLPNNLRLEDTLQLTPNSTGDVAEAVQLIPGGIGDVINNITDKRESGSDYSEDNYEIPSSERPVRAGRRTREFEKKTWPPIGGGLVIFQPFLSRIVTLTKLLVIQSVRGILNYLYQKIMKMFPRYSFISSLANSLTQLDLFKSCDVQSVRLVGSSWRTTATGSARRDCPGVRPPPPAGHWR